MLSIPCSFIQEEDSSVLKVEGETSKLLSNWKPISGTPNLIEFNSEARKLASLKKRCKEKVEELKNIKH
jgi:hypothetical protein